MSFSAALEHTSDMVIVTDRTGHIEYVNASFETITGYKKHEAIGNTMHLLSSGKQEQDFYTRFWDTITQGNEWRGMFINKKKNGIFYYVDTKAIPVKNSDGEIMNFVALQRDVTPMVEQEKELILTKRVLCAAKRFSSSLVSVIKNDVASVLSSSPETVSRDVQQCTLSSSDEMCLRLRTSAEKLTTLVLEKPKNGSSRKLKLAYHDINACIASVVKALLPAAQQKQILLDYTPHYAIHKMYIDADHIKNVVAHLISNAVNNAPEHTTVHIDVGERYGFLEIKVTDHGMGLAPDEKEKIFDPSILSDTGQERGLVFSKGILEAHNGCLGLETIFGKGCTFIARLPIEKRVRTR